MSSTHIKSSVCFNIFVMAALSSKMEQNGHFLYLKYKNIKTKRAISVAKVTKVIYSKITNIFFNFPAFV